MSPSLEDCAQGLIAGLDLPLPCRDAPPLTVVHRGLQHANSLPHLVIVNLRRYRIRLIGQLVRHTRPTCANGVMQWS
jgi:hypothetical protein